MPDRVNTKISFNKEIMKALLEYAVHTALQSRELAFNKEIEDIKNEFKNILVFVPEVEVFKHDEIIPGIQCDELLDIAKSVLEFEGKIETYVS